MHWLFIGFVLAQLFEMLCLFGTWLVTKTSPDGPGHAVWKVQTGKGLRDGTYINNYEGDASGYYLKKLMTSLLGFVLIGMLWVLVIVIKAI